MLLDEIGLLRRQLPAPKAQEFGRLVGPPIAPAKRGGNKRTMDVRAVINGLMCVLSTGCQWAALPKDLLPKSTVHDYFQRWIVERSIAWLNRCRRLAKDWECRNRSALAFLRWASVRLMIRKLCQQCV